MWGDEVARQWRIIRAIETRPRDLFAAEIVQPRKAAERTIGFLKERRAALIAAAVTGKIESLSSFA